ALPDGAGARARGGGACARRLRERRRGPPLRRDGLRPEHGRQRDAVRARAPRDGERARQPACERRGPHGRERRRPPHPTRPGAGGRSLEDRFYPEVRATFALADRLGIDPLALRGSGSGAFGYPQFLPTNYLRYGTDGDGDGVVDLYDSRDAAASCANYLAAQG